MKALVKKEKKPGLWLEEVPKPTIGDNDVLIKTRKASICGTDLHIYQWDEWAQKNVPVPLVVGHEFMGEVVEVGKNVSHVKVGDRVSGEGHVTCGSCINCLKGRRHLCLNTLGVGIHRHGCFAEYFPLPAENVFVVPQDISDDLAAVFDPLGNAVHTALSFDLVGEDVLITGAGPIGIMAVAIAKQAGARNIVVTDMNPYRLELAKKMGATAVINIQEVDFKDAMAAFHLNKGFTVGLEMSGSPEALNTLLEASQPGAHIALLGILPPKTLIDWDHVIFKILTLKGIYGREIFSTWFKMCHMLQSGLEIAPIITHHYAAEDFEKAFQMMFSGNSGKIILNWGH